MPGECRGTGRDLPGISRVAHTIAQAQWILILTLLKLGFWSTFVHKSFNVSVILFISDAEFKLTDRYKTIATLPALPSQSL